MLEQQKNGKRFHAYSNKYSFCDKSIHPICRMASSVNPATSTSPINCNNVNLGKYTCIGLLGRGAFGIVYKGFHTETGDVVAIKKIALNRVGTRRELDNELKALKQMDKGVCSQNAICYRDLFYDQKSNAYLVTDFVEGTTIDKHFKNIGISETLTPEYLVFTMYNLAYTLFMIHESGIAHNDIQPDNIMVTSDNELRFIDFGLSCIQNCSPRGRLGYIAPEKLDSLAEQKNINLQEAKKADVYSIGVIMWNMANGTNPRSMVDMESGNIARAWRKSIDDFGIPKSTYKGSQNSEFDQDLIKLVNMTIECCLEANPSERLTSQQLLHYVTSIVDIMNAAGSL